MQNPNENPQPKGTLMVGPVPLVPLLILLIWGVMAVLYYTIGLPHNVSLPIVVATLVWFVLWLFRAARV